MALSLLIKSTVEVDVGKSARLSLCPTGVTPLGNPYTHSLTICMYVPFLMRPTICG